MGARAVDVSRVEIFERDNRICYLCAKFIGIHDLTLDHVQPLTEGGEHTPENVRAAHRVCNSKKGARAVSEIDFLEW